MSDLMSPSALIDSYRSMGYKSTASAIAELIDNSIQAKAKNIYVISYEAPELINNKNYDRISSIGVYDDGIGMNEARLKKCLGLGQGERKDAEDGLGKYGVGLPQASISQAKIVTVYSWQGGKCRKTYISVDEIREGEQRDTSVQECEIPDKLLSFLPNSYNKDSGTFVHWENCDKIDVKQAKTLNNRLVKDFCRIYRHFLDDDDKYGKNVNVEVVEVLNNQFKSTNTLCANDPIYLLTPNTLPEFEYADGRKEDMSRQKTNITHAEKIISGIPYFDKKTREQKGTADVKIIFTHVMPEIRKDSKGDAGKSLLGKHYAANIGISFVREAREIDIGEKGFYESQSDPTYRWLGVEVQFPPTLDEFFGVSNTKQQVTFRKFQDEEYDDEDDLDEFLSINPIQGYKRKISVMISNNIKTMHKIVKEVKIPRKPDEVKNDPALKAANRVISESEKSTLGRIKSEQFSEEELQKERVEKIKRLFIGLNDSEVQEMVERYKNHEILIEEHSWPGELFFDIKLVGSTAQVLVNTEHQFFEKVYNKLKEKDPEIYYLLQVFLYSYGQATQEFTEEESQKIISKLNSAWGKLLHDFGAQLDEENTIY